MDRRKIKQRFDHWWNEPNPEGVTRGDVAFMLCFTLGFLFTIANAAIYLHNHPEVVEWIANVLFPAKNL